MIQVILEFINSTGIAHISLGQLGMIIVSCILFYLAIAKGFANKNQVETGALSPAFLMPHIMSQ